ncbi:MAG: TIGR03087 family PEP-CTERM/XrtA system glycosyltransferase [Planctomycetota bacterium]|nr:TIGR03087 family PEP-CTERM/XrtA system glycosyltransferase [Planctomycetota bacterium]
MRARKNILYLANRVPYPPDKGDKIRSFHQMDHLARFHNVYCAAFADTPEDLSRAATLRQWCAAVAVVPWGRAAAMTRATCALPGRNPLSLAAYRNPNMSRCLSEWAGNVSFDAVIAFSSTMAPYALGVPAGRHVLDLCDVDSQKWLDYADRATWPMSMVWRTEGTRLRIYEQWCLRRFDAVLLITEQESRILDPRQRCPTIGVIPNGVRLPPAAPPPASRLGPVVGFVGTMDYRPNIEAVRWFVRNVWPHVLESIPAARFTIVGRNPVRAVRRLASTRGVEVTGAVQSVPAHLRKMRVFAAPLSIARGIQNKVLEAMAFNRPVVATSSVANTLQVENGRSILVADDAVGFARRIVDLCEFDKYCDQIGEAGFRAVAASYCWADVQRQFEIAVLGPQSESVRPPPKAPSTTNRVRSSRPITVENRLGIVSPPGPDPARGTDTALLTATKGL